MNTRWVFGKLKPRPSPPSSASSVLPPFKTLISPYPSSPATRRPLLDHVDISSLLSMSGREGNLHLGSSIHASLIKSSRCNFPTDLVIWNSLLHVHCKCGVLCDAVKLFDEMPIKDTVSWNTLISGFSRNGYIEMGFQHFKKMYNLDICHFDRATLTILLSSCDGPDFLHVSKMVHALIILNGLEWEVAVGNALITSYFNCGCFSSGRLVFGSMTEKNVITWTAVISGLAQNQFCEESLKLFMEMCRYSVCPNSLTYLSALLACSGLRALREGSLIHGLVWKLGIVSDLRIESALMDMYSKCGCMENALQIFESAEEFDEVSMTVILVGFAQNGFEEEAVRIFVKMVKMGTKVDPNMVSAVLGVFGNETSLALGKQIHSLIIKKSFGYNPFVYNGLINMYSKCGELEESVKVFNWMPQRNSISYNSVIAAFARHGDSGRAFQLYDEMRLDGQEPTDVTFLSLLHASSHVGAVDKGMEFLESMERIYGLIPRMEHYASVVDMLGRAGLLSEAKSFIERLPVSPGVLVWQALLGACSFHGDSEIGNYAANQLFLAAPSVPAPYILLANIYSSEGRWKDRAKALRSMKEMGVAKVTGISWIEVEKKIHSFVVYDHVHPQAEVIYCVLYDLFRHMSDEDMCQLRGLFYIT